jgi:hypothetical protein
MTAGCATAPQYQPQSNRVTTLGHSRAQEVLQEVTRRSINPQMVEVTVTEDAVRYRFKQVIAGFATGAILENTVYFLNAEQVQVYPNNVVILRTMPGNLLAKIVFGNQTDARTFADLVASFHDQARKRQVR